MRKSYLTLFIITIIIFTLIACDSDEKSSSDSRSFDDSDDDDNSDDDDTGDDDDSPLPAPFTYDDLEFQTVAGTEGYFAAFDMDLDSQSRAGICLIESVEIGQLKYFYGYENEEGQIELEELDVPDENFCSIVFDDQDRPVIMFIDKIAGAGFVGKIIRKEQDGNWADWTLEKQEGEPHFLRGNRIDSEIQFTIDAQPHMVIKFDHDQINTVSYPDQLGDGDASWACDTLFLANESYPGLYFSELDFYGSWEQEFVDEFKVGIKELRWISIANTVDCNPRILATIDENPPPEDTKSNEDADKDEDLGWSLRLYRQNPQNEWEYSFIQTNLIASYSDMEIDPLGSVYVSFCGKTETADTTISNLSLAVGTWEDFEIVTLYDQTEEGVGETIMKADNQNRLHFLFQTDWKEGLVYGRPSVN